MPAPTPGPADRRAALLGKPEVAAGLRRYVRSRAPASEVEDVVQATLADALASRTAPEGDELLPWLYGIARNKIADVFRRTRREAGREPLPAEEVAGAESAPTSARDLLRWAERELPDGDGAKNTLEWMLREGDGEKLEAIAAEENVPAPRVRQRVARLRRHFRARWAAQLAAAAVLVAIGAFLLSRAWRKKEVAQPEPAPSMSSWQTPELAPGPVLRAAALREDAFEACDRGEWETCKTELEMASKLDPAGDADPKVIRARRAADEALMRRMIRDSMHKDDGKGVGPAPVGSGAPPSSLSDSKSTPIAPEAPKPLSTSQVPKAPPVPTTTTTAPPPATKPSFDSK